MATTTTERNNQINVIALNGRVDAFNAPTLREQIHQPLEEGVTRFVIDLSATSFLDSAAMAVLVSLLKRARQGGGDVKLVWPEKEAARRVLSLTRFDRVFDVAESAEAAAKSF